MKGFALNQWEIFSCKLEIVCLDSVLTHKNCSSCEIPASNLYLLLDFSLAVKAAPHECVIRTSQP